MFKNPRNAAFLFYPPRCFPVRKSAVGRKNERKKVTRETRERWPLLNFETEVNGDSKEYIQIKVVLPCWCTGLNVQVKDFVLP
jgi:hypothetical protein